MSVEIFFATYPAHSRLRDLYIDKNHPDHTMEGLSKFLRELGTFSRNKLVSVYQKEAVRSSVVDLDTQALFRTGTLAPKDFGGVFLAGLVPSLHEMLVDQRASNELIVSRINEFFVGTPLPGLQLNVSESGSEAIASETWLAMARSAQADKTLASLIRNRDILPEKVRRYLVEVGILSYVGLILDDYEQRARIIVSEA